MTREEREAAIAYIKSYRKLDENLHNTALKDSISYYATAKCLKYWDMAIQALSQEPCDDAINRDAVIYYIKGHIHEIITESGTDKNAHTNSILRALINGVETMPSVTHKSGKWISLENRFELGDRVRCSNCGQVFVVGDDVSRHFCPNCGCRMVESQESEDK